jgi:circadian clock protein KaiC
MSGSGEGNRMESTILTSLTDRAVGPTLDKTPTGISGLDQITGGGLPRGRVTLVAGSAGAGKTLLGMNFLVAGAREYGEPGVLMTFEESADKVASNVRSLGFDLDELQRNGMLVVLAFRVDPSEITAAGDFDFEPIFAILADAIEQVGAKRVVLDTIEVIFGAFGDDMIVRSELIRLVRWLDDRGITAVLTGERGSRGGDSLTRHGIEEYVTDCVIVLDHRVTSEISTRRLRVVKYRGSAHGTNEYPFLISARGFTVLPITAVALDYAASDERVSTGIPRLDHMLGGGMFRGSTLMVTGTAGTGKTSLGAHVVNTACERGEHALMVLLEESPEQVLRNMRSIGLDLQPWVDAGLLRIWAARPSAFGLETHLAVLAGLIEEEKPSVAILDGIANLSGGALVSEVTSSVARQIDLLKSRGITSVITALGQGEDVSAASVSAMADTWLQLRNIEANGERNRLLFVLKSRGTSHSNQVREFVLTDHGVELVDVYIGAAGVLAGSARVTQLAAERDEDLRISDDLAGRRRELNRSVIEREAHLVALQDQLDAERTEMQRIDLRAGHQVADTRADRSEMAARRWADDAKNNGEPQ